MMSHSERVKLGLAIALLGVAGVTWMRGLQSTRTENQVYFYDLSAEALFAAPQPSIPPIAGIDGPEEDAVRAVVIAPAGQRDDEQQRRIAYLEKYSPALKQQFIVRMNNPGAPPQIESPLSRAEAKAHTFVKRPGEETWHPMTSPQAQRIVTQWQQPGPDGALPVICLP